MEALLPWFLHAGRRVIDQRVITLPKTTMTLWLKLRHAKRSCSAATIVNPD